MGKKGEKGHVGAGLAIAIFPSYPGHRLCFLKSHSIASVLEKKKMIKASIHFDTTYYQIPG